MGENREAEELRGLLARLEWVGEDYVNFEETVPACPACSGRQEDGHTDDCWLDAAIRPTDSG